jgi:EAL and modified HD-GYP domain-containing signal transduction protein
MLARQPIFDAHQNTYAYELLYRGESMDIDGDTMTATVLSNTLNRFGIETMTHGKLLFIDLSKGNL